MIQQIRYKFRFSRKQQSNWTLDNGLTDQLSDESDWPTDPPTDRLTLRSGPVWSSPVHFSPPIRPHKNIDDMGPLLLT